MGRLLSTSVIRLLLRTPLNEKKNLGAWTESAKKFSALSLVKPGMMSPLDMNRCLIFTPPLVSGRPWPVLEEQAPAGSGWSVPISITSKPLQN